MRAPVDPPRVGVIVVAYNAESTVDAVLDRIPATFWQTCAGVWLSDDGSTDSTHEIALLWWARNTQHPLTIVRQPVNLGYGGNQKAGYRWAIDNDLDVVVLLHGDGQYAPEIIDELVRPITEGGADAVMGSRMLTKGGARRGGMPRYKFVGNRILSRFQNVATGATLSEWHSGYRAYAVQALREIAFLANSDGFDFDTEILLQLLAGQKRIVEVPIPTYYGDEICRVAGLRYAAAVVADTVSWRLHRSGLGSGDLSPVGDDYVIHHARGGMHHELTKRLSGPPQRVLDLGCAAGYLAAELTDAGHTVVGVDAVTRPGVHDRMALFVQADLEQGLPGEVAGPFDVVVAADVLEHLRSPEHLLAGIGRVLSPNGVVLVSVPNMGHWYPRLRALLGMLDYDQRGLLDRGHVRFFNRRSLRRLARLSGFFVCSITAVGVSPDLAAGRRLGPLQRAGLRLRPTLFAYQFLAELVAPVSTPVGAVPAPSGPGQRGGVPSQPDGYPRKADPLGSPRP